MSWSRSVLSEMASDVGYDSDAKTLLVTWKKSGKTSAYADVPEEVAIELSKAASVGQMIITEIKPQYRHIGYV